MTSRWLLALACVACTEGTKDDRPTGPGADDSGLPGSNSEVCNGVDDDGDGEVDEDLTTSTWYVDADSDGVGDSAQPIEDCAQPAGTATRGGDCDDTDPAVFPGNTELCNGIDDDCDDTIDGPTAADAVTRYPDDDGDGYGTEAQRVCPGDAVDGWLSDSPDFDCDDTDPAVHPSAPERCNGIDDDCDPGTGEEGAVRFVDFTGDIYDWEAGVLTGQVAILRPGTLELCHGTHPMTLRPRAELTIVAAAAATSRPLLSGLSAGGPALLLRDDDLGVSLEGVDLEGGQGTGAVLGEGTGGGAIECDTDGTLTLTDTTITGGEADVGGSILVRGGCTLDATAVTLERGTAAWSGGLVAVLHGEVVFTDSDLSAGTAPVGAGVAVVGWEGPAHLTLDHSSLHGGSGARLGGAAYVEDADLTCVGDAAGGFGIHSNSALEGGGAWMARGSTFEGTACDMGTGTTDNRVHDVAWDDLGTLGASWSGAATFTCTDEGCE